MCPFCTSKMIFVDHSEFGFPLAFEGYWECTGCIFVSYDEDQDGLRKDSKNFEVVSKRSQE